MRWASTYGINRKVQLGRLGIRFSWRRNDGFMGRFGGGWNWKVGVQVGGRMVLVSLLVFEITFHWEKKDV